ncbi:MAG: LLM class flavin-dependent oxidoreductase [Burkholderiales bacterium]
MKVPLGVLDQSPVISGTSPAQALAETIALARFAEDLGYHRYWLAEHHAIAALADPCPEILAARVASATSRIRVGTGGVLLPYYSPLKVAEVFRMLEALFPGRIDLGLGRAPGGDPRTVLAMTDGEYEGADRMPQQVHDLVGFLDRTLPAGHPFAGVKAQPAGDTSPEVWLLGSSDYSGALAARLGLRFAFAHFINAHGGDAVSRAYRDAFEPSAREPQARSLVCAFVICAGTRPEAERLAASIGLRRLHMAKGVDAPVPTVEEARAYRYSPQERAYVEQQRSRIVLGDPGEVRESLLALQEKFAADEIMVITITGDYESRRTSYRLLAEAFA